MPETPAQKQKRMNALKKELTTGTNIILKELILAELMRLNDNLEGNPPAKDYLDDALKRIEDTMKANSDKAKAKRKRAKESHKLMHGK